VKTRKWPYIVGVIVVILLVAFAAGAASASQGGGGLPPAAVTVLGLAVGIGVVTPLIRRMVLPRTGDVSAKPGVVQFTISPLEPFTTSIAAVRQRLGDGDSLPKFGSFARPLVAADSSGITIWKSAGDELPLGTIPAASIRSIISEEQRIQVSRIGVTSNFFCIIVELTIESSDLRLVLPACTPVNEINPGTRELVDAWAAQLRGTLDPEAHQPELHT
jgi:hypothetical protein